jgi:hypothetical protein
MTKVTEEMKQWFGDGEVDVDCMLACGAITESQIIELWEHRNDKRD